MAPTLLPLCYVVLFVVFLSHHRHQCHAALTAETSSLSAVAFHIAVHPSNIYFLNRLILRIYHPKNVYLIDYHVSIPSTEYFIARNPIKVHPNIYERRADVMTPDGVTQLLNVLDAMAFFINRADSLSSSSPSSFSYFIPLTPSSYPTLSSAHLRKILDLKKHVQKDNKLPNFFHFTHPSQLSYFSDEVDTHFVDLALSFNGSINTDSLYTHRYPHPDRHRRTISRISRSYSFFIASEPFVRYAVDSPQSTRLLVTLSETSHVSNRFFATLATVSDISVIGPVIRSDSLHCIDSNAIDVDVRSKKLEKGTREILDYRPHKPSLQFVFNSSLSRPCLFIGPFDSSADSTTVLDNIDERFGVSLHSTQLNEQRDAHFESLQRRLFSLVHS